MNYNVLQKYFFFLIIAISSCRQSSTINRPDVSDIKVDVKIQRFDEEFANQNPKDVSHNNLKWSKQYPYFYKDFMDEMLAVGNPQDTAYIAAIVPEILKKKDFVDLMQAVRKVYPNMDKQQKELAQALRYIKYYFPEYKIPQFITFVSGFAVQTPVGEDYVGIGLDMFLGADSEFYPSLVQSIPLYISQRFTPENITPRVIEAILREDLYPQTGNSQNTLQHMIYNGKILYAMDVLLENVADENKIGYTKAQLEWAKKYQSDIWAWFLGEKLLYSSDYERIQKYFSEAPFTPELGENNESAPKLGSYIGWMIIRKYMEKHPEMDLVKLFSMQDAQQILEDSKFKGK